WWYSDIASTPRVSPSLRMLSDARPFPSANATAARSTRSRLSGLSRLVVDVTRLPPCSTLHRKSSVDLQRKATGGSHDNDSDRPGQVRHRTGGRAEARPRRPTRH